MSMRGGAGARAKPPRLASHHGLYNQVIVEPAKGCCNDTCHSCSPTLCLPSDKGPLFSEALPDELDRIVPPDVFAEAVRGLNDVLREHQPSGCGATLAALLCPCTCGLAALWCQRQLHVAYAEGMLYLTAVNARPTWRAVGITWSLERVKLAMHLLISLTPPAEPGDVDEGAVRLKFGGSNNSHTNSARSAHPVSPTKAPTGGVVAPPPAALPPQDTSPVQFHEPDAAFSEFALRYHAPIFLNHRWYPTATHWFQSQKFEGTEAEQAIRGAATAAEAFRLSRLPQYARLKRTDWRIVKERVMLEGLRAKFTQHADLSALLMSTGSRPIAEHSAVSKYWADGGDGSGANRLGYLIQRVRSELASQSYEQQPAATSLDEADRMPPNTPIMFYDKGAPFYEFTNFFKAPIIVAGLWYATSENYFQSKKFAGSPVETVIGTSRSAADAFRLARAPEHQQHRRLDWADVKDEVMLDALRAKFTQHAALGALLLSTGCRPLVEHTENDKYWADAGDGSGANRLGALLQHVRGELRERPKLNEPVPTDGVDVTHDESKVALDTPGSSGTDGARATFPGMIRGASENVTPTALRAVRGEQPSSPVQPPPDLAPES